MYSLVKCKCMAHVFEGLARTDVADIIPIGYVSWDVRHPTYLRLDSFVVTVATVWMKTLSMGRSWRSLLWSWEACYSSLSLQTRSWSRRSLRNPWNSCSIFIHSSIFLLSGLSGFVYFCFGKSCSRRPLRRLRSITINSIFWTSTLFHTCNKLENWELNGVK